jgi:hypothetical protein
MITVFGLLLRVEDGLMISYLNLQIHEDLRNVKLCDLRVLRKFVLVDKLY